MEPIYVSERSKKQYEKLKDIGELMTFNEFVKNVEENKFTDYATCGLFCHDKAIAINVSLYCDARKIKIEDTYYDFEVFKNYYGDCFEVIWFGAPKSLGSS